MVKEIFILILRTVLPVSGIILRSKQPLIFPHLTSNSWHVVLLDLTDRAEVSGAAAYFAYYQRLLVPRT